LRRFFFIGRFFAVPIARPMPISGDEAWVLRMQIVAGPDLFFGGFDFDAPLGGVTMKREKSEKWCNAAFAFPRK